MKTQIFRRSASFLGVILLTLGLLLGQAAHVQAISTVLYVAPGSGCTGTPNCYATVQAAVDVAASGNEIRVAAGTYTDMHDCPRNDVVATGTVKAVACVNKTVTIRGGYNNSFSIHNPIVNVTTLNAQNAGRVLYVTGAISPVIADLSLTGGNAAGLGGYFYYSPTASGYDAGGGVYIYTATTTLTNNRIFYNISPKYGGGVYIGSSASQLTGNTINNNSTVTGGGGLFLYTSPATLTANKILSNTSGDQGGGLWVFGSEATLANNTLKGNTANRGGGIAIAACSPSLSNNIISGNTADSGGGASFWYSQGNLTNNVFANNQASSTGSGLWIGGSTPTLLQTTINYNTGGDGSGVFATDDGNAPAIYSTITMKNTIVVNQTLGIKVNTGSSASLDGVLWYGNGTDTSAAGVTIAHGYSGDPRFFPDGYHLMAGSAAIDKGVNAGVSTDIDGQGRLGAPDLGADEYWPGIFLPMILRN